MLLLEWWLHQNFIIIRIILANLYLRPAPRLPSFLTSFQHKVMD